jgi:hypothetical protein
VRLLNHFLHRLITPLNIYNLLHLRRQVFLGCYSRCSAAVTLFALHSPFLDDVNGAWNRITNTLYIMHAAAFVIPYQAGFT